MTDTPLRPVSTARPAPGTGPGLSPRRLLHLMRDAQGRAELRRLVARRIDAPPVPLHVNEAVNRDLEVIYVAVPKTGSTTVRTQISPLSHRDPRYLIRAAHLDIRQIHQGLRFFEQTRALDTNRSFPHSVPDTASIDAAADAFFDRAFKFSTVRNPWARAVSLYFRKEGVQVARDMSFAEFIDRHDHASDTCRSATLHRHQRDWLTDAGGAMAVDYVFRIEDMDSAVAELREVSDGRVRLAPAQRANVNRTSRSDAYRDMYDARLRARVARQFEVDIDQFKYTF